MTRKQHIQGQIDEDVVADDNVHSVVDEANQDPNQALVDELTNDIKRIQAEYVNFRRRSELEKVQAIQVGKEQAVLALIPVLDNIERAIQHEPADIKDHTWVKGIGAVASQLQNQMEAIGLVKIGRVGEEFDPHRHEGVGIDDSDGDIEVVAEVLQSGYQFNESILRPAMVKLTKQNKKK